ncbi:MAG: hypothetical protein KDD02_18945 [Phaeodactylibacter sp.]|nr:hypothetical protein [Phaeodactylibacter sp.]MCB9304349.1 hypothetical protein [Lewinellaceae bacterium]HQU57582.1 heavy metal-binding domain-containing protein [Saprospiraceae bacterium]
MKLKFLLLFVVALGFASCGGNGGHTHEHNGEAHTHESDAATMDSAKPHGEGKEYTSAYVCPMHCEGSGSDQPGNCPVCGMDYEAQAEHVTDGHNH